MNMWVKALRSGDYLQGKGRLVTIKENGDERFCCLGVLCNLATENGYGEWSGVTELGAPMFKDEYGVASYGLLPTGVMSWAGMKTVGGHLMGSDSLYGLNDNGKSFAEIADHIEANYKDL